MHVEIYSKTACPYCTLAKNYLKSHQIAYTEHVLDDEEERQAFYRRIGDNVRSVPQIFVDGERIGGYAELVRSDLAVRQQAGTFDAEF